MSRCGDFRGDDDRQTDRQTNRLLYPCACARGNDKNNNEANIQSLNIIQKQEYNILVNNFCNHNLQMIPALHVLLSAAFFFTPSVGVT